MIGKNVRRAIKEYSITKIIQYATERYKRKKLYRLDCEKEAERIARELDINKKM